MSRGVWLAALFFVGVLVGGMLIALRDDPHVPGPSIPEQGDVIMVGPRLPMTFTSNDTAQTIRDCECWAVRKGAAIDGELSQMLLTMYAYDGESRYTTVRRCIRTLQRWQQRNPTEKRAELRRRIELAYYRHVMELGVQYH